MYMAQWQFYNKITILKNMQIWTKNKKRLYKNNNKLKNKEIFTKKSKKINFLCRQTLKNVV